jgi:hypothetical protein
MIHHLEHVSVDVLIENKRLLADSRYDMTWTVQVARQQYLSPFPRLYHVHSRVQVYGPIPWMFPGGILLALRQ